MFSIRRINGSEDPATLRDLRLRALGDAPHAFPASYQHEAARPFEEWERRAHAAATGADQTILIAEVDGRPVGMAGGFRPDPESGDRQFFGLWIEPEVRGTGLGESLVEAVSAWAGEVGARRLMLWVTEINTPAVKLYERLGFERSGVRQTLPSDPRLSEIEMTRTVV